MDNAFQTLNSFNISIYYKMTSKMSENQNGPFLSSVLCVVVQHKLTSELFVQDRNTRSESTSGGVTSCLLRMRNVRQEVEFRLFRIATGTLDDDIHSSGYK